MILRRILSACALFGLAACGSTTAQKGSLADATLALERTDFAHVDGWGSDQTYDALFAFRQSCARFMALPPVKTIGSGTLAAQAMVWQEVCARALQATDAQGFFQAEFTPFRARSDRDGELSEALFTGYYEPELRGSLINRPPFTTPLYPVPPDLEARKKSGGFFDRAQIDQGALAGLPPLVWVDDPVDAFFLEIQGSGVVKLVEGGEMRVGFAGQNGHPYVAIGKVLLDRGWMEKGKVSAPTIKDWLRSHPAQMREILWENPSYVFFKVRGGDAPVGAQGAPVTPERSLAVDKRFIPLGMPVWITTDLPTMVQGTVPWKHLLIAQDVGGAIKGPTRADVFFGRGMEAEYRAGNLHGKGTMTLLVPNAIAGRL